MLGRVAGVDDLLAVLGDGPEPGAQVMVDVGGQIGDAVVEDLLPQCGLLQRILGLGLAPFEVLGEPPGLVGIVERGQLDPTDRLRCSAAERISSIT